MGDTYRFTCPGCGEQTYVDSPIRRTLLRDGCLVCGAAVTRRDFSEKLDTEFALDSA